MAAPRAAQMADALKGREDPMTSALFSAPAPHLYGMAGKNVPFVPEKSTNGADNKMRDIQLVRHGATSMNNADVSVDRIRGWKNVPLSAEGKEEAERIGDKIKQSPPDVIVSSDLKRAHDTAKIISKKIGVPIKEVSQSFRPWNVGDYAGKTSSVAIPVLAKYAKDTPDKPLPGGESFNSFRDRFFTGLTDVLGRHDGKVAIVTHHRNERLLNAWLEAGAPDNGKIDIGTFNKKGEAPGAMNDLKVPVKRLPLAAAADGGAEGGTEEGAEE
jgi:broad specificity phosphatase PhoE